MSKSDEIEPDRYEEYPHPRESAQLIGHHAQQRALLDAYRSGRFHHGWILGGEAGIGKASFAYMAAKFLFAHPDPDGTAVQHAQSLSVASEHPAARKVVARSHPDLVTINRFDPETSKVKTQIGVETVRRAIDRLMTTSGEGGWRVCIVDCADDLNVSSANALLKTLEEPLPRTVFLIVSHAPGRLLPTIRSRCRRLDFEPLPPDDLSRILQMIGVENGAPPAQTGEGSIHACLAMLDETQRKLVERVAHLAGSGSADQHGDLIALCEAIGSRDAEGHARIVVEHLRRMAEAKVKEQAVSGERAVSLAEFWSRAGQILAETEAYNLDRRPMLMTLFDAYAQASQRGI
jgi:DNA polymerase III subunit delta'